MIRECFGFAPRSGALLVLLFVSSHAFADPVTFSTSGTITSTNEPDQKLYGVTNASPDSVFSRNLLLSSESRDYIKLGSIHVIPMTMDNLTHPIYSNSPFDIRVEFNDKSLPSLEIKGIVPSTDSGMGSGDMEAGSIGTITSITSSAPELNINLPAPFANMIAHPDRSYIGTSFPDWDISQLAVYAIYSPNVPEPATSAVMVVGFLGLAFRRWRKSRAA